VIHPIPSGTRDVLPDELREVRAITDAMRAVFDGYGYGEVATPTLEYEAVLTRGDPAAADPAYRLFDEHGHVLVLRSDMTIPIARVVASRYPSEPVPLRFCYVQHAYRAVRRHRGQPREILQAGIELVGAPGPDGTAEAIAVLCAALDAAGLAGYRVGVGDASLFARALARHEVPVEVCARALQELDARDFVGLERELEEAGAPRELARLATTRGGPEVLEGVPEAATLRELHGLLAPDVAERVIYDLGLLRSLGYYTGAVFEVYDAAFGAPMGGGGRYDDLLGRFGRALPACGWALDVERVHAARLGEGR
jgi:ATP phosphoribosyltransferase regulatory subunit